MAAPASAAPIACSAICAGVIGRYGDIVGVWIAPVTAQVTITERLEVGLAIGVAATRISCERQSDTSGRPAHPRVAQDATAHGSLDGTAALR